jgi:hypothetical protein
LDDVSPEDTLLEPEMEPETVPDAELPVLVPDADPPVPVPDPTVALEEALSVLPYPVTVFVPVHEVTPLETVWEPLTEELDAPELAPELSPLLAPPEDDDSAVQQIEHWK